MKDSYPITRVDNMFDRLASISWFSFLDLKSGYWHMKIRLKDKKKTAFSKEKNGDNLL